MYVNLVIYDKLPVDTFAMDISLLKYATKRVNLKQILKYKMRVHPKGSPCAKCPQIGVNVPTLSIRRCGTTKMQTKAKCQFRKECGSKNIGSIFIVN